MNDAKEEVRSRLAIEDVIGEYVQLKRAGRYWRGLSPFTNEKTPSFFVTPERDIWHDFSSNQGGDIFSFIELVEGVSFREALELLARKAGVDLSQYDQNAPRDLSKRKERILSMNVVATNYFQREMTKNRGALDYIFKKRKLSRETALEWGIGFAPENPSLKKILLDKKFDQPEIRGAGLVGPSGGEMFRSRMMIPLRDGQGQVVGFTGRIIGEGMPKYLNTPATLLYDKGRQVFGLNFAKQAIRAADFSVIVEGNLDVISSHQAGVKNVVACAGTALTTWHLKSLGRLSRNVRLCFDGDKAGVAATERAIGLAEPLDLKLSVINLPDEVKDPDELIQKGATVIPSEVEESVQRHPKLGRSVRNEPLGSSEKEAVKDWIPDQAERPSPDSSGEGVRDDVAEKSPWQIAIENTTPAVDWVMEKYAAEQDLSTADGKKELTTRALKLIRNLSDAVEIEFYLDKLARLTGVSLDALKQKMYSTTTEAKPRKNLKPIKSPRREYSRQTEQFFLNQIFAVALKQPRLRSVLNNLPDEYLTKNFAELKYFLLDKTTEITPEMADKMAELEIIAAQELAGDVDERLLMLNYLNELEKSKLRAKFDSLNAELAATLENESDDQNVARAKLLNGAVNGLKKDLTALEKTSARDDFAGLRQIWGGRKGE